MILFLGGMLSSAVSAITSAGQFLGSAVTTGLEAIGGAGGRIGGLVKLGELGTGIAALAGAGSPKTTMRLATMSRALGAPPEPMTAAGAPAGGGMGVTPTRVYAPRTTGTIWQGPITPAGLLPGDAGGFGLAAPQAPFYPAAYTPVRAFPTPGDVARGGVSMGLLGAGAVATTAARAIQAGGSLLTGPTARGIAAGLGLGEAAEWLFGEEEALAGAPVAMTPRGAPVAAGGGLFRVGVPTARALPMLEARNPATGRMHYWRHMGRPILFSGDVSHARRVQRVLRRQASRAGVRRPR